MVKNDFPIFPEIENALYSLHRTYTVVKFTIMYLPNTYTVLPELHSSYQVVTTAFTIFAGIKPTLHSLNRTSTMVESTVTELT